MAIRRRHRGIPIALLGLAVLGSGCMSLSTKFALLSDSAHLGTPYSGVRVDLHVLICFARAVRDDRSAWWLSPLALFHLVDLPFSGVADTLFLVVDIPREPEAPPLVPGESSCRLIGM